MYWLKSSPLAPRKARLIDVTQAFCIAEYVLHQALDGFNKSVHFLSMNWIKGILPYNLNSKASL
jgi:hypothetical protein